MNNIKSNRSIPSRDTSPTSGSRSEEYGYSLRSNAYFDVTPEPFTPRLVVGRIIEINPQLQSYKVRIGDYPTSDITAVNLEALGSSVPTYSASSKLFGIGSAVIILTSRYFGLNFGIILGALPENLANSVAVGSPELVPASPVGSGVDKIAKVALNSAVYNFNGGRPIDIYPTDISLLSYFGAGLFVGSLQTTLRASSECAVECHYVDSLLRLTSYNFEQFSAGADVQFVADCGDYTEIRRGNPYVIESVGGNEQYGSFPKKEGKSRADAERPSTDLAQYIPENENQIGWWRWLDLSGYLANVKLAFVIAPKLEGTRKGAEDNGQQDEHALFREHVDSTGAYSVASAKSISLIKDCLIPLPKEQYRADDSRGDNKENIEKARNDNKQNLKDAELEGLNEADASILYSAASSDMASFRTHRTLVRFRERAKDWSLKEIDEVDLAGFKSAISSKGLLSPSITPSKMYADLPQIGKLKINANEEVNYFASRSMIMMHEDGSIHIQDGYGAAISMRGGCIDITCPGDITLRPGRNLVGLAGDSASIIGGVDVELCGMKGDIRVQADRNVSVLSGNDGQGGILLETRARYAPLTTSDDNTFKTPDTNNNPYRGIWFKASDSGVCTLANEAYIGNAKDNCKIVMDCGSSDFSVNGTTSYFLTSNSHFITAPNDPESGTVLSIYGPSGFQMVTPGSMYIRGSAFMASGPTSSAGESADLNFYVKGNFNLLGNSIMENIVLKGEDRDVIPGIDNQEYINSVETPIGEILAEISQSVSEILQAKQEQFDKVDESLVGKEDSTLENLTFYYPDSLLRGIPPDSKFVLLEADWQMAYRSKGQGKNLEIRGVPKSGVGTVGISSDQSYCWPGIQALESKFAKLSTESRFVDGNLAFKRTGFDQPLKVLDNPSSFQDNYRVIDTNKIRIKE